jgi:hypothetical protein
MRILWTEVHEGGVGTNSKILLWYVSPHKKVRHYIRQIDDSLERLNRRTPAISDHHPGTAVAAQQDGEQVLACPEAHKGRMMIDGDQVLLDPLADKKPWDRKDLRVDYLKFKRDIFPAVLAA